LKQRYIQEKGSHSYTAVKNLKHENDVVHAVMMMMVNILMTMKRAVTVIGWR